MRKLLVLISLSCMLISAGSVHGEEKDLFASVKKSNTEHTGWSNFFIQSWAGKLGDGTGIDSAEQDPEYRDSDVYKVVGGGKSGAVGAEANRVVCWYNNKGAETIILKPGKIYTFKARLKTKNVDRIGIKVISRGAGFKSACSNTISGTNDWAEYSTPEFVVSEECDPQYFNIDMWGPGTYWVSKISLIEADIPPIKIKLPIKEYNVGDSALKVNVSLNKDINATLLLTAKITGGGKGKMIVSQNMKPTRKNFIFPVKISKLKKTGEYEITVGLMRGSKLIGKCKESFTLIEKESVEW